MEKNEFVFLKFGQNTAKISRFAAHVVEAKIDGADIFFLSKKAVMDTSKAIRGGIPIIWPQFSNRGPLPSHGFVRNKTWRVVEAHEDWATFELQDDEETRKLFPHAFKLHYVVRLLQDRLSIDFEVVSVDSDMDYTFALHSYFKVSDITHVNVKGLQGVNYQDHLKELKVIKSI